MSVKFGLVSYKFINNDIEYNISQIEKAIKEAKSVDMLCFGEGFLQGHDSVGWNYEDDKKIAITKDSLIMKRLEKLSLDNDIDLAIGYFENSNNKIYCSYAIIIDGKFKYNSRKTVGNWQYFEDSTHNKEEQEILNFSYKGLDIVIGICADLFEYTEKFKAKDLLIWPVFLTYLLEDFKKYKNAYTKTAFKVADKALIINSLCDKGFKSYGGSFYLEKGNVIKKLNFDQEGILIVEI